MDISNLKRDSKFVKQAYSKVKGKFVANRDISIVIPAKFAEKKMAIVGSDIHIAAIYAMIVDDKYAVSNAPVMIEIHPSEINITFINDEEYYEFKFSKGDIIIGNTSPVRIPSFTYNIFDSIQSRGLTPWYLNFKDDIMLFDGSIRYANANLNTDMAIHEIISSYRHRDPKNLNKQFRHVAKSADDYKTIKPKAIGLRNIHLGTSNVTSKLMGSEIDTGLSSALVTEVTKPEPIEQILKG